MDNTIKDVVYIANYYNLDFIVQLNTNVYIKGHSYILYSRFWKEWLSKAEMLNFLNRRKTLLITLIRVLECG